ncbi:hypothetical protein ILUMI_09802 [Ignelater luminosus]|uniref:Amine oxidase n=1 Tax=Ignelater luminosus TaxID=2038154 RepID=A0A8K0GEQ3_IGNLU|nr:hypothetical protein ILUMI_09802 [Ignelater luminosus]
MYPSFLPNNADIIIVGAGISGMTAAFYILEKEPTLTVLVLEAKQRIGGRTLSTPLRIDENNFRSYDLGGQFISSSQVHLSDLIHKLGLELVRPLKKTGKTIWNLDKNKITPVTENPLDLKTLPERLELLKFFEKIYRMGKEVTLNNPHSIPNSKQLDMESMESFIKKHLSSASAQNFMRHVIRTSCGIEPSQLTVLYYLALCNATDGAENQFLLDDGGAKELWIRGGADSICQRIASSIGRDYIKVNDPVIEILRDDFQVIIETENKTYTSKYVIISIPPKEILDITFTPPLSSSRVNLLHAIDCGYLIKFVITYEKAFWKEKGFSGDIVGCGKYGGHGPIHACYDITYDKWPALTGYIASNDALEQPPETYQQDVLSQLAKYFGDEALHPLEYFEKSWLDEPYIYNCLMNCPGFSNMDIFHELRRPVGRMFWAGTETATHWNGYMGGAVQAGYRAAIEVLYDFRPQLLTIEDIHFVNSRKQRKRKLTTTLIAYGTDWKVILSAIILLGVVVYNRRKVFYNN